MSSNPRTSPHYSTTQDARKRPKVCITLSHDAIGKLEELAAEAGESKSAIVETLILSAETSIFKKDHQGS